MTLRSQEIPGNSPRYRFCLRADLIAARTLVGAVPPGTFFERTEASTEISFTAA